MRLRVACPRCDHEFDLDVPVRSVTPPTPSTQQSSRSTTRRGITAIDMPIRDDAHVCSACGLTRALHEGADNLAWARYGCDGFLER